MARDSIEHSFLPGASLWAEPENLVPVPACAGAGPQAWIAGSACEKSLAGSEKARVEWNLERLFEMFEEFESARSGPWFNFASGAEPERNDGWHFRYHQGPSAQQK